MHMHIHIYYIYIYYIYIYNIYQAKNKHLKKYILVFKISTFIYSLFSHSEGINDIK